MINTNLNIGHNTDHTSIEESVDSYRDIQDGYVFHILDISFSAEEFKKILIDIKELYPNIKEYDYSRGKNNIIKQYFCDDIRLYVSGNSIDLFGSFYTKSNDISQKMWDIYTKHSKESDDIELFLHSYTANNGKVDDSVKIMTHSELNYISEKYYPYIDTEIMFEQFFTGHENILLIVGEPGLGKSKLSSLALKYAFENTDKLPYDKFILNPGLDNQFITVAMVKSTEVLSSDSFWSSLESLSPDFCIIDDLDYMLTKRDSEIMSHEDQIKNAFLNQFLSFTDGVEKRKTKFIITTNQNYSDIDTALLRKGRLFDILELRKLDKAEALIIWKENGLDQNEFDALFDKHQVLSADLGSEISKRLNKRIKNPTSTYLKESGISKVQRASKSKKIVL